jgi:hypothetical protein
MSDTTEAVKDVQPLITITDEGVTIPEVSEILTFTTVKCVQLMDEMVAHGLITEMVSGFPKMSLPDKRDALVTVLNTLTGADAEAQAEPEVEFDPIAAEDNLQNLAEALAEPTKAAKPKKGKKAKATSDGDPIIEFASRIEKLNNADQVNELIKVVQEDATLSEFKLGGALSKFHANPEWYQKTGYQHFRDWVETVHGISYRKAMYTIDIYNSLLAVDFSWEQFENIGWTKIMVILPIIKLQPENISEWVGKAKEANTISLIAAVKEALKPGNEGQKDAPVPTVVTKTFKLHPDQKEIVEAALTDIKQKTGTAVDTVALEYMAQNYMGSGISFSDAKSALNAEYKKSESPEDFLGKLGILASEITGKAVQITFEE